MNDLGVALFKKRVKIGEEISVATVLKDHANENIHYRGTVTHIGKNFCKIKEGNVSHRVNFKDVYWHSAETKDLVIDSFSTSTKANLYKDFTNYIANDQRGPINKAHIDYYLKANYSYQGTQATFKGEHVLRSYDKTPEQFKSDVNKIVHRKMMDREMEMAR